jgi:hypothetical protein
MGKHRPSRFHSSRGRQCKKQLTISFVRREEEDDEKERQKHPEGEAALCRYSIGGCHRTEFAATVIDREPDDTYSQEIHLAERSETGVCCASIL